MTDETPKKKPRGFSALTPAERREIARRGGLAAAAKHALSVWTPEKAREMARKGGNTTKARHGVDHLRAAGRLGGIQKGLNAQARREAEAEVAAEQAAEQAAEAVELVDRAEYLAWRTNSPEES